MQKYKRVRKVWQKMNNGRRARYKDAAAEQKRKQKRNADRCDGGREAKKQTVGEEALTKKGDGRWEKKREAEGKK